jgi:hypothetical protein
MGLSGRYGDATARVLQAGRMSPSFGPLAPLRKIVMAPAASPLGCWICLDSVFGERLGPLGFTPADQGIMSSLYRA